MQQGGEDSRTNFDVLAIKNNLKKVQTKFRVEQDISQQVQLKARDRRSLFVSWNSKVLEEMWAFCLSDNADTATSARGGVGG